MSTLIFFEKDSLVENWKARMDNAKVEVDKSLSMRCYDRFNIVKVVELFIIVQSTLRRKSDTNISGKSSLLLELLLT
jgi:hypothetical protein